VESTDALTREDVLLGRLLVDAEFLTHEQLHDCVELQKMYGDGRAIGRIFVEMSFITETELQVLLAIQAEYFEDMQVPGSWPKISPDTDFPLPARASQNQKKKKGRGSASTRRAAAAAVAADADQLAPVEEALAEPGESAGDAVPEAAAASSSISGFYTYKVRALRATPLSGGQRIDLSPSSGWLGYLLEKLIAIAVVGMAVVMVLLVVVFVRDRFVEEALPEETGAPRKVRRPERPPEPERHDPAPVEPGGTGPDPSPSVVAPPNRVTADSGTIAGIVCDGDGRPVPDVTVTVADPKGGGLAAVTGLDGCFLIERLPPDVYTVSVAADQNRGRLAPDSCPDQGAVVEAGRTVRIRFGGAPQGGAALLGCVTEESRNVPGAYVTLVFLGGGDTGPADEGIDTKNGTTDARGEYRFEDLTPGNYSVLVTHPTDPSRVARAMVDLTTGGERRRDLRFSNLVLRGRVVDAKTAQALPGVSLFLQRQEGGEDPARMLETLVSLQMMSTFTDENGGFDFTSMEEGNYTVVASLEGYATRAVSTVSVAGGGVQEIEVSLPPGGAVIEGTIRRKSGPIPPETYVAIRDASENVLSLRRVDRNGEFEVDGLAPGAYRAVIFTEGQAGQIRFFTVSSDAVMNQEFEIP